MKNTQKHTPGPWEEKDGVVYGKMGIIRPYITDINDDHNDGETKANARLVAASPELLSSAIEALHALEQHVPGIHPIIRQHLASAIAKAEGKE